MGEESFGSPIYILHRLFVSDLWEETHPSPGVEVGNGGARRMTMDLTNLGRLATQPLDRLPQDLRSTRRLPFTDPRFASHLAPLMKPKSDKEIPCHPPQGLNAAKSRRHRPHNPFDHFSIPRSCYTITITPLNSRGHRSLSFRRIRPPISRSPAGQSTLALTSLGAIHSLPQDRLFQFTEVPLQSESAEISRLPLNLHSTPAERVGSENFHGQSKLKSARRLASNESDDVAGTCVPGVGACGTPTNTHAHR